jgi:hypothetical protein
LNENNKFVIDDNLIRRALQLEIESVEPPAADQMWRSIEARLDHSPVPLKKPAPVWIRYAGLAAAACLLLIFGGIGLMRVVQFSSPTAEYDAAAEFLAIDDEESLNAFDSAPSETADEPLDSAAGIETKPDLKVEQQNEEPETVTVAGLEEEPAGDQNVYALTPATDEYITPLWPETLGEDYLFSEEIVLPPVEEDPIRVALYSGPELNLLLVSLEALEENPIYFVEKIGLQMQFPINDFQYQDSYLFFVAGGYNGLVFQHDGMTRAILAPLNSIKKEQLIDLAAPFR